MTATKQTKPQVPLKDFYTIQDVAALIQVSGNAVRNLAYQVQDPPPDASAPIHTYARHVHLVQGAHEVGRLQLQLHVRREKGRAWRAL